MGVVRAKSGCTSVAEFEAKYRGVGQGSLIFLPSRSVSPVGSQLNVCIDLSSGETALDAVGVVEETIPGGRNPGVKVRITSINHRKTPAQEAEPQEPSSSWDDDEATEIDSNFHARLGFGTHPETRALTDDDSSAPSRSPILRAVPDMPTSPNRRSATARGAIQSRPATMPSGSRPLTPPEPAHSATATIRAEAPLSAATVRAASPLPTPPATSPSPAPQLAPTAAAAPAPAPVDAPPANPFAGLEDDALDCFIESSINEEALPQAPAMPAPVAAAPEAPATVGNTGPFPPAPMPAGHMNTGPIHPGHLSGPMVAPGGPMVAPGYPAPGMNFQHSGAIPQMVAAPQPEAKRWRTIAIGAILVCGLALGLAAGLLIGEDKTGTAAATVQTPAPVAAVPAPAAAQPEVGDTATAAVDEVATEGTDAEETAADEAEAAADETDEAAADDADAEEALEDGDTKEALEDGEAEEAGDAEPALAHSDCEVEINSRPRGAKVTLVGTGQNLGKTPFAGKVPCGSHKVRFSKSRYRSETATFEATADEVANVSASLSRPTTKLSFRSSPAGAVVRIDGKKVGKTPLTRRVPMRSTVSVTLSHDGFETYSKKVSVGRDSQTVKAMLRPSK